MTSNNSLSARAPRRGLFYTLRSKLLISFGLLLMAAITLVSLARTFGIPFTRFSGSYAHEREQVFNSLNLVADIKKERLRFWLAERKGDARFLADTTLVGSCVKQVRDIVQERLRPGITATQLRADLAEQDSYKALIGHFQLVLGTFSVYHAIQVADPKTGVIIASTDDRDVGLEIEDRQALAKALYSPQGIAVEISKPVTEDKPHLHVYAAIPDRSVTGENHETTSGVLLLCIDSDDFVRPLLYAGAGLGKTGDIVLVNQDRRLLLQPRYPLPDGRRLNVLEDEITGEPAQLAVQGHEGIVLARDYRGVPVVAACRHIVVTPDMGWGLVVKRDEAEVFGPLWHGLMYSLIIGVAGMLVGLVLISFITNRISRPIEDMSRAASEVEGGNLSARAHVVGSDEVGSLGNAFNSMIERVQDWHKDLEEQVSARTAELAHERERLAITLRSIGDGVISTDTEGRVLSVNEAAEGLTGWSEVQALGKPLEEVFHIINEKTRELCENPARKVLQRGTIVGLANHTVLISRDGTERVLADSAAPIRAGEGSIIGVVLVFRDVTEIKRAEEALRESEERYRLLLHNANDAIYVHEISPEGPGRFLDVNDRGCRMLGYSREEFLAMTVADIDVPEHLARIPGIIERLFAVGGAVFETDHLTKDGRLIPVEASTRLFDIRGRPTVLSVVRDITERKRAEEALRASEANYRTLAENIPGIVYRVHLDEPVRMKFFKDALLLMTGFTEDELKVGEVCSIDPLIFPEDRVEVIKSVKEALAKDAPFEIEYRILHKDGETRHFLEYGRPVIGKPGSPSHIDGVIFDVTERKKAEEALVKNEQLLRSILVASPVGICLTRDRILKWANDTWARMFGFKHQSEYLDQPTRIIYSSEEDYLAVRDAVYADLSGHQAGEAYAEFRRKDGSLFNAHLQLTYLDPLDPTKGTVSAITDISEKKRAESAFRESEVRYRTLFEESLHPIFITDSDGKLVDANQAYFDLFGYTRGEIIGENVLKTYADPQDRVSYRMEIDRMGFVKDYPVKLRTKDGRDLDCLISARVQKDGEGTIVGYRGFIRDVTEQKNLERQLIQAQKMEAIGTLAGGVAHDFNNLLQVVLGYSDLLLADENTPHQMRGDLNNVLSAAKRGADLVQRLLTFSRRTETRPRPIRLNRELEQVSQLLARTIPKMIEIRLLPGGDTSPINADPIQIEQIMLNLAVNARDAMPQGGSLIIKTENTTLDEAYCKTHLGSKPGPYVLLTVSDTGSGMDKATLEHIFEPFYTTKGPGEGTGLGLAMVYGIVKQQGGYITCTSEPGKGTTFKIYFPAFVSVREEERGPVQAPLRGGTETILLVDDEEPIRNLAERNLQRAGYSVLTASNGKEALENYRRERDKVALVILDLIMPEMGGMECLEELLKINPKINILVASGQSMNGQAKKALGRSSDDFCGWL